MGFCPWRWRGCCCWFRWWATRISFRLIFFPTRFVLWDSCCFWVFLLIFPFHLRCTLSLIWVLRYCVEFLAVVLIVVNRFVGCWIDIFLCSGCFIGREWSTVVEGVAVIAVILFFRHRVVLSSFCSRLVLIFWSLRVTRSGWFAVWVGLLWLFSCWAVVRGRSSFCWRFRHVMRIIEVCFRGWLLSIFPVRVLWWFLFFLILVFWSLIWGWGVGVDRLWSWLWACFPVSETSWRRPILFLGVFLLLSRCFIFFTRCFDARSIFLVLPWSVADCWVHLGFYWLKIFWERGWTHLWLSCFWTVH